MTSDRSLFPLPLVFMPEVFHVGSFDPSDKGEQGSSLEGNGLSFSLHPDEWTAIARLGGRPTWKLSAEPGHGHFLDSHSLTDVQNDQIFAWGIQKGFVERVERWKASWIDSERDSDDDSARSWSLYPSQKAALFEVEDCEDAIVEAVSVHGATPKMIERCGFDPGDMNSEDILKTFFSEDHGLDGVWWNDALDPCMLSAPRGVINPTSLDSWDKDVVAQPRTRMRAGRP